MFQTVTNHIMDYETSIKLLAQDVGIRNFFTSNSIDIYGFVRAHVRLVQSLTFASENNAPAQDNFTAALAPVMQKFVTSLHDKLVSINNDKLNDLDRKTVQTLSNFQSNIINNISSTLDSHAMHHKITSISDTLTTLNNNFTGNSSQKGKMTENILYHNLVKAFPDCDVDLTRNQSESCDIQIKKDGKPPILIDSKHCEASNVRKSDLDKFYSDCKLNNACGILCNAFGGIANRKNFEIDIQEKRVYVFLSNHEFDPCTFQLAARIIYNIHSVIQDNHTDSIHIDQQLYQRLKIEYTYFLQSFQQHLDKIKANVNSLSQLAFCHLDQFFKRSCMSSSVTKPFSCHLCATGCNSPKTLKKHLKDKHGIGSNNGLKGRPKKNTSQKNNVEDTKSQDTNSEEINTEDTNSEQEQPISQEEQNQEQPISQEEIPIEN